MSNRCKGINMQNDEVKYSLPEIKGARQQISSWLCDHRILISRLFSIIFVTILIFGYRPWTCSIYLQIAIKVIGFFLVTICVSGRIWSATYIGGRKTRNLVSDGPYSMVRHPLYMFSFIGAIGIGLSSMNTYLLVAIGVFLLLYYPGVIYHEQRKMESVHGEEYMQYRSRVPALIPTFRNFTTPDELTIKPAKFLRDLIHAMYFFMIYLLFEAISYWHLAARM